MLPIGFVLYVLLAQPRGLLTGLPAAGIPAAIAAKIAYGNELLARADYDSSAAAASQGRHVALVVLACAVAAAALRAAALPLDRRLEAIEIAARRLRLLRSARRARRGAARRRGAGRRAAPDLRRPRDVHPRARTWTTPTDLRTRLTSAVDNGRIDNWRVALDGFDAQPLHGTGAGTYRITWDHDRPAPPVKVNDGHSLYLETLSELGVVGLVLLLIALGTILVGGVVRLGGRGAPRPRRVRRGRDDARDPRRRSTGTGRCRRCSSGCSARAASCCASRRAAARRARADAARWSPRWRSWCSR